MTSAVSVGAAGAQTAALLHAAGWGSAEHGAADFSAGHRANSADPVWSKHQKRLSVPGDGSVSHDLGQAADRVDHVLRLPTLGRGELIQHSTGKGVDDFLTIRACFAHHVGADAVLTQAPTFD